MIVETKIIGRRKAFESRQIDVPEGEYTLQSLLDYLVKSEVEAYNERQSSIGILRVLRALKTHIF